MKLKNVYIRDAGNPDVSNILEVQKAAFAREEEALLTAAMLKDETADPFISLLAFHQDNAVGHILFSRAYLNGKKNGPLMHILAPLAVVPYYQKQGIGGLLIMEGVRRLIEMGSEMIFVLGHMEYYPR